MEFWRDKQAEKEYNFYIEVACLLIQNYLHFHNEWLNIEDVYPQQTVMLAAHIHGLNANIIASLQNNGIKQVSSNGRSVTFMSAEELASQVAIPQYIKDMLPCPTNRVRVW
jgi:hypothetical protein